MVEELNASIEVASAPIAKLGVVLQVAREEKKLSLEDVSNRLRLSLRQIKALEGDDFSILPEATITRGFIRNYARLLEIDPEPLLSAYKAYAPSSGANHPITLQSANILISSTRKPVWIKYIVGSIVIALAVGAWVVYMDYFPHLDSEPPVAASVSDSLQALPEETSIEPMPEAALPFAEREAEASTGSVPDSAGLDQAIAPPVDASDKPIAAPTVPATPPPIIPPAQVAPALNVSEPLYVPAIKQVKPTTALKPVIKVRLTVNDTTWVSVTDEANNEIVNRTIPAGGVQRIEAVPPLKVVIGNADGAQLTVNDKPYDLSPYNKLNVVRLTLE